MAKVFSYMFDSECVSSASLKLQTDNAGVQILVLVYI